MRTREGQELSGKTAEELVADLHAKSFTHEANDRAFMDAVAHRTITQTGNRIRHDTAEHFIDDLLKIGLLLDTVEVDKPQK